MLLAQSALIPPVLLLPCDALAGGACTAGGGVTVVAGGGACAVSPSPAGGGVDVVAQLPLASTGEPSGHDCASPAGGGGIVAQLPLASTGEPSGHDCAYEDCSIDNDCTVRIAAVTRITLVIIIIDSLLYMICSSCL
jgi:hypothetical protein